MIKTGRGRGGGAGGEGGANNVIGVAMGGAFPPENLDRYINSGEISNLILVLK